MNILGLSGHERAAAAAIIRNGVVLAAIEEEKLARVRHVGIANSGGLPHQAVGFCLKQAGITFNQVDYVAYYMEPGKFFVRNLAFRASRIFEGAGFAALETLPFDLIDGLNDSKQRARTRHLALGQLGKGGRFAAINHQLAHGASAFYPSKFERAAVIAMGNIGDMTSTCLMTASPEGLRVQAESRFPNSLGMVYSTVTAALFGQPGEEHKTTWLSATGEPEFINLFRDMLKVDHDGLPLVSLDYFNRSFKGGPSLSEEFFHRTGTRPRTREEDPITEKHRNIASSLQMRLNEAACEIASRHRERTGEANLCLAGGVGLNSLTNRVLEEQAGYRELFVQPAAGNAGCSLGAALYVWHDLLGNHERPYQMEHVFMGPQFGDEEIKSVLDNCKLRYEYFLTEDKLTAEVARLLSQGRIIGWFRGQMEFGPRALGARSILASPGTELMRDNLNSYIKHREDFRPFSASVPEERIEDFFEPSSLTNFLQGVCRAKPAGCSAIPAAVFGDGIARVHGVRRKTNQAFWKLLVKFGDIVGAPVLLNTSFNLFGEPVVSTPREAVRGFYCSGIDCLAIENFLIKK
jgi:carbamoyltransferase